MASEETRELYCSPNGDSWHLVWEPESGRVFVRHFANVASGGRIADIGLWHFLLNDHRGAEHEALRTLIGTLAKGPPEGGEAGFWEDLSREVFLLPSPA